jgi:hypothetical protein
MSGKYYFLLFSTILVLSTLGGIIALSICVSLGRDDNYFLSRHSAWASIEYAECAFNCSLSTCQLESVNATLSYEFNNKYYRFETRNNDLEPWVAEYGCDENLKTRKIRVFFDLPSEPHLLYGNGEYAPIVDNAYNLSFYIAGLIGLTMFFAIAVFLLVSSVCGVIRHE